MHAGVYRSKSFLVCKIEAMKFRLIDLSEYNQSDKLKMPTSFFRQKVENSKLR